MLQIDIIPLSGINIHNIGEVHLGQARKDVENLLGLPDTTDTLIFEGLHANRAFYDQYELKLNYDDTDAVEFIEFNSGPSLEKAELRIYGVDPFKEQADKIIAILSAKNFGRIDESEAPYSYAFENISVGVWRQSIPAGIQEWISEAKADSTYEIDKNWLDEELERSNHFWTIGIGRKGYYNS